MLAALPQRVFYRLRASLPRAYTITDLLRPPAFALVATMARAWPDVPIVMRRLFPEALLPAALPCGFAVSQRFTLGSLDRESFEAPRTRLSRAAPGWFR